MARDVEREAKSLQEAKQAGPAIAGIGKIYSIINQIVA